MPIPTPIVTKTAAKKVVIVSDLHCGSRSGVTTEPKNAAQEVLYQEWCAAVDAWKRPDILICMGDAIDGRARHDVSQTQHDTGVQTYDAFKLLSMYDAGYYVLIAGSDFHVAADGQDFEPGIVNLLNANRTRPVSEFWDRYEVLDVNGLKMRLSHKVGGSVIPHGVATAPLRSLYNMIINSALGDGERVDIVLHGHTHNYLHVSMDFGSVIVCPCWQALGNKFANRYFDGRVVNGSLRLHVEEDGGWSLEPKLFKLANNFAGRLKL